MIKITYLPTRLQGPLSKTTTTVLSHLKAVVNTDTTSLVKSFSHSRSFTLSALNELIELQAISMNRVNREDEKQAAA
jgi:hypothetical protein